MTKPNENQENQNTLMAWATGYLAIYAIGIAAGIFIWKSGMIQKATGKLFSKDKKESE
jgi:hypothetical protein